MTQPHATSSRVHRAPSQPVLSSSSQSTRCASVDLWQTALDALSPDDCALIDRKANRLHVLEELLRLAEAKRDICLSKRWKYSIGGKTVFVRDKLEKIVEWVQRFKHIGSNAVQYDAGHAALPWAALLFLLQIGVNDMQIHGAMLEGIEMVSGIITRCSVLETYLTAPVSDGLTDQLRIAMTKLYVAVLRYLARARKYFGQRTITRLSAAIVQSSESHVSMHLDIVSKKAAAVDALIVLINNETTRQTRAIVHKVETLLRQFEQPMLRTASCLTTLEDKLNQQERRDFLEWLSKVPIRLHHQNVGEDFMQGSCAWLLRHHEYRAWANSSSSTVLWLHGIPGSGKTNLIYHVIEHLCKQAHSHPDPAPIAYFYCARNPAETTRSNPNQIMRSLLRQLGSQGAERPISDCLVNFCKAVRVERGLNMTDGPPLTTSEATKGVLSVLKRTPATIVIDAIDECDPTQRHELIDAINSLMRESGNLLKVLISSRDDGDIFSHFANSPNVYISADLNGEDIEHYIRQSVSDAIDARRMINGHVSPTLKKDIIDTLIAGAGGMFRWVTLQVQNLCNSQRIKIAADVRAEIGRLPRTLAESYDMCFQRITELAEPSRDTATHVLQWLLCSQVLMTASELSVVASAKIAQEDLSEQQILDSCSNLVVADTLGILRFAHLSIREYLEEKAGFSRISVHTMALQRCLGIYMAIDYSHSGGNSAYQTSGDLFVKSYAAVHWLTHYEELRTADSTSSGQELVRGFVFGQTTPTTAFIDWLSDAHNHSQYSISDRIVCEPILQQKFASLASANWSPMFLACCFDLLWIAQACKDLIQDYLNLHNNEHQTPLYLASKWGSAAVVEWILNNELYYSNDAREALHVSILESYPEITSMLIDHGVDPQAAVFEEGESSLDLANRQQNEVILLRFLGNPADASTAPSNLKNITACMSEAYQNDLARSFEILNAHVQEWPLVPFLMLLSTMFFTKVGVAREVSRHAMLKCPKRYAWLKSLHEAGRFQPRELSRLISIWEAVNDQWKPSDDGRRFDDFQDYSNGIVAVEIEVTSEDGDETKEQSRPINPLEVLVGLTIIEGKVDDLILEAMLSFKGLSAQARGLFLYCAIEAGSSGIGANVIHSLPVNSSFSTRDAQLLQRAIRFGSPQMWLDVLKEKPLGDPSMWRILLEHAMRYNEHTLVDLLLQALHKTAALPNDALLLTFGLYLECVDCLEALANVGVDLDTEIEPGKRALHFAAKFGYTELIRILLKAGADCDCATTYNTKTAVHYAVKSGQIAAVTVLLDAFANVDAQDAHGRSALFYATSRGYFEIVKELVDRGANLDLQDENGNTALHEAVMSYVWDPTNVHIIFIINVLLRAGARFDLANEQNDTVYDIGVKVGLIIEACEVGQHPRVTNIDEEYGGLRLNPDSVAHDPDEEEGVGLLQDASQAGSGDAVVQKPPQDLTVAELNQAYKTMTGHRPRFGMSCAADVRNATDDTTEERTDWLFSLNEHQTWSILPSLQAAPIHVLRGTGNYQ